MNQLIPTILKYFPDWNKRVHSEEDIEKFCTSNRIVKVETDLIDDLGEYRVREGYPFILINKFVTERHRLWVSSHECGHHIFHTPLSCKFSGGMRKIEIEANIVAAGLLIPQHLLVEKHFWEIQDEFNYPRKLIEFRKDMYDKYRQEEMKWLK